MQEDGWKRREAKEKDNRTKERKREKREKKNETAHDNRKKRRQEQ